MTVPIIFHIAMDGVFYDAIKKQSAVKVVYAFRIVP